MERVVELSSELTEALDREWALAKEGIALANQASTSEEQVSAFHCKLKRAMHGAIADCRARAQARSPFATGRPPT